MTSARDVLAGIRRLERGLRLAAGDAERATGLSAAQLFSLEKLAEMPAASITVLAARTHTDRSSVSAVVDRLVAAGLVSRNASASDRRRSETRITRKGKAVLARAPKSPTAALLRALGQLPEAKVRQLANGLSALNEQLGYTETAMLFDDEDGDGRERK